MTLANNHKLVKKLGWLVAVFIVALLSSRAVAHPREHARWDEAEYFTFTQHLLDFHQKYTGCHVEQRSGRPGEDITYLMRCSLGVQEFDSAGWDKLAAEGAKLFGSK